MSDKKFYTHQHAQGQGDTVVSVQSLMTVLGGSGGVEHANGDVRLAVGNQISPYKPPARRGKDSPGKVLCSKDGCKAYPMKEMDLCTGHARSSGLIENWKKAGREA